MQLNINNRIKSLVYKIVPIKHNHIMPCIIFKNIKSRFLDLSKWKSVPEIDCKIEPTKAGRVLIIDI